MPKQDGQFGKVLFLENKAKLGKIPNSNLCGKCLGKGTGRVLGTGGGAKLTPHLQMWFQTKKTMGNISKSSRKLQCRNFQPQIPGLDTFFFIVSILPVPFVFDP